jgi:DNA-binding NarL/FixJ family response regulator
MRCLLVDDNDHFLEAARGLLEREGVAVVGVASTSSEALQRLHELRPDVALIDIDLGPEDGFDLAERIARAADVIMISAYAERDFADMVEASPAIGFVSKSDLSARAILGALGSAG